VNELFDVVNRWLAGEQVLGVTFSLNDPVRIRGGRLSGELAAVISIAAMGIEPTYVVELGRTGEDVEAPQSRLEHAV
jgi:hypothetical protein